MLLDERIAQGDSSFAELVDEFWRQVEQWRKT